MIPLKSLGVYKNKPAWVAETGEKLTLLLPGGETLKVREKDIEVIFPGPCTIVPIENSDPEDRDVREAWELLSIFAGPSTLKELAELVFLEFSPQSAWGAWRLLAGGLYFSGTPSALVCRPEAWVRAEQERRAAKETQGRDFEDLIRRLRSGELDPSADRRYVQELEALALGRAPGCRILKALGREESPGEAHALLLQTGVWTLFYDPHPARAGCPEGSALLPPPPPRPEPRRDLTGLPAFAIDSPWSDDPDDAVSLEGEALYVHVADPTASLNAGDEAEGEARRRGSTLYLPQEVRRMLSQGYLDLFALGGTGTSPALTFKLTPDPAGGPPGTEIFLSTVKVRRMTYEEADRLMEGGEGAPTEEGRILARLGELGEKNWARRLAAGAADINLPEVHIAVRGEEVDIAPILPRRSSLLVRECMLLAGEGAAAWARERGLAFPYAAQQREGEPLEEGPPGDDWAAAYKLRGSMRPRRLSTEPAPHEGLGLAAYSQVTSPLRRYSDLLAHLQIRSCLRGEAPLDSQELLMRLGAGESAAQGAAAAERASRTHWTLVYLSRRVGEVFQGVMLARKGERRGVVLIPALAMETQLALPGSFKPNDPVGLVLKSVNVPRGEAVFVPEIP